MKRIAIILAVIYLFAPLYIVKHVGDMSESHFMSNTDCPYISGENSMCPISLNDHISAWKSILLVVLPKVILLSGFYIIFISFNIGFKSFSKNKLLLYWRREKYKDIYRLFVNLFSKGILNSKAY